MQRLVVPQCGEGLVDFEASLRPLRLDASARTPNPDGTLNRTDYATQIAAASLAMFQAERVCASFIKWRPLLSTPKEHVDMLSQEWMRAAEERDRKWREDQARQDRRWRMFELFLLLIWGVVAAIVGAVLQKGI